MDQLNSYYNHSKVEMRKMAHERASSHTPVLAENSLNMDTEALEGQDYDLDLSKFTSRVVETYCATENNNWNTE